MPSTFTCAISGELCTDPVVSPSGHIYERRLILSKLAENGNCDPFVSDRPLSEDQLISLVGVGGATGDDETSIKITPPARSAAPTMSGLLQLLQKEHDALLLELFDARQALEETRMELSQALYQNDAAVRVIARLAMERDGAVAKLANANFDKSSNGVKDEGSSMQVDEGKEEQVSSAASEVAVKAKINDDDMAIMVDTWKKLSKARKKRSPTYPTFEELSKYQTSSESNLTNLHRVNKPHITCLVSVPNSNLLISGGKDKCTVVYNTQTKTIVSKLASAKKEITCLDANDKIVVIGSADGTARVFHLSDDGSNYELSGTYANFNGDACKGVSIHPTGKYIFVLSSAKNKVVFCNDRLEELAIFGSDDEETDANYDPYTCIGMHPDGLILSIGTTKGNLKILDLKSQKFASILSDGHSSPVTSVAFSENGYHFASSSAEVVVVWDLRKLKIVKTLNNDENGVGRVNSVQFDLSGKYLAYAGEKSSRICVVKDWDKIASFDGHGKAVTSVVWGDVSSSWFATAGLDKTIQIFSR